MGFGNDNDGEAAVWLPQGYTVGTELMGSAVLVDSPSLADMFGASIILLEEGSPICALEWISPTTGIEQQIGVYVGDAAVSSPTVPPLAMDEEEEEEEQQEEEESLGPIRGFFAFLGRIGEGTLRALNALALFFARLREG